MLLLPLAGKRRGPESVSDAESSGTAEAPSADNLAMVPLTPSDSHAVSLRRSSREHKKPRPYYVGSEVEPPDRPSNNKGMQRGFLELIARCLFYALFKDFPMVAWLLLALLLVYVIDSHCWL